ncbi:unnamed protein product [Leuciscus chuanchicus]
MMSRHNYHSNWLTRRPFNNCPRSWPINRHLQRDNLARWEQGKEIFNMARQCLQRGQVAFQSISSDPCYNYESLDRPWRANNESGDYICDESFSWNGWYRLFYYGMDIRMSETCVSSYTCNTYISLWLNDPHPQIEDGVVTREVCGSYSWGGCCDYKTKPIRVKACPGNYYVYELVNPVLGCAGYCTDVNTTSQAVSTISPDIFTGSTITLNYDPCNNYNILDNYRRSTLNYWSMYGSLTDHDDTRVEWDGWYRLFINGSSAQMPEWCFYYMSCGSFSSLWLNGSHPRLEDGVVTREIYGSRNDQCSRYRSDPIQVKACPGNYYIYKLTRPTLSIPAPVYCAVSFSTPSVDPCYNYTSLDEPWRSTDNSYYNNSYHYGMCDYNVEWNGWYRMFYNGENTQMPESCVNQGMCGTYNPLWLNGPHPQLEDGVVTQASSQSISSASTTTETIPSIESITPPITTTAPPVDPCYNYTVLDDSWRATNNQHSSQIMCDTAVSWNGWYRLFIQGQSVQMPDTCVDEYSCGTHAPLWLNGGHPTVEDGVVTRDVCGHWWNNCCAFQSNPINVKACPGDYYVYEFVSPTTCSLAYCAESTSQSNSSASTTTETIPSIESMTPPITTTAAPEIFYPFGSSGDTRNAAADDGSSIKIQLLRPFLFFGRTYQQIYVNNNGHLTFNQSSSQYFPYSFPSNGSQDIIAGLWTDLDNSARGVVSYHQYTNGSVLTRATQDINNHFPNLAFSASWVFVATWDKVPYLSMSGTETSFQVVLISGSHFSFILMNYGDISVTERQVEAGYDTVTSTHYFVIPGSVNGSFIPNLKRSSNVNVTGRWAFRVDGGHNLSKVDGNPCSELSCSENESCGIKNGVYGCLCKKDRDTPQSHSDSFDVSETCESSSGSISVSRCQLFEAGFPADVLHLNDPSCKGTVRNGRVEFHFDNDEHICGTNLVANSTHFIYDNFILGTPRSEGEGLISREKILKLSFSCVYPQSQTLSMNVEINPLESMVRKILPSGEGRYQVRMIPYQDDEFTRAFTGRVDAELDQEMHVEVRVEGVDSRQFALVMDTCWATPVNDPDYSLRWDLILSECPNPIDDTVELLQNGVSTSSRFSFGMFIFTANSTKLYLHCAVHLCLLSSNRCSTVHPFMTVVFPGGSGLYQQDNAPCHTAHIVQEWLEEHGAEFKMLPWPPNSPDLNPIEHL